MRERMYRIWYWAMIDRESNGRFIASIPDLGDLAAYGENEKDAVGSPILVVNGIGNCQMRPHHTFTPS
jgi:hypothetical protein